MQQLKLFLDSLDPRLFHAVLALVIGAAYYAWRRFSPATFERLPKALQPLPALLLAGTANVMATSNTGQLIELATQLGLGVLDGVLAVGGHHVLKALPGPYGSSSATTSQVPAESPPNEV